MVRKIVTSMGSKLEEVNLPKCKVCNVVISSGDNMCNKCKIKEESSNK